MNEPRSSAEDSTLVAGSLILRLAPRADRFGHVIESRGADQPIVLLESIEGDAVTTWPPSPALQSVDWSEVAAGKIALLVGMAGKSHWSASYESHAASAALVLDWACRVTGEPAFLGTSYHVGRDVSVEIADDQRTAILATTGHTWTIEARHGRLTRAGETLRVVPLPSGGKSAHRWAIHLQAEPKKIDPR